MDIEQLLKEGPTLTLDPVEEAMGLEISGKGNVEQQKSVQE